ncbi:MAG: hypothetical protein ABI353_21150 [Isosphaeraceae bacterium]
MSRLPPQAPRAASIRDPDARRRVAHLSVLWGGLALSGTLTLGVLLLWHLLRRGRLLRDSLPPPRARSLIEPEPADSATHETLPS